MGNIERRIAICQHPNGEGVWWDADRHGPGCIQDCDCEPAVYVLESATTRGAVGASDALASSVWDALDSGQLPPSLYEMLEAAHAGYLIARGR